MPPTMATQSASIHVLNGYAGVADSLSCPKLTSTYERRLWNATTYIRLLESPTHSELVDATYAGGK